MRAPLDGLQPTAGLDGRSPRAASLRLVVRHGRTRLPSPCIAAGRRPRARGGCGVRDRHRRRARAGASRRVGDDSMPVAGPLGLPQGAPHHDALRGAGRRAGRRRSWPTDRRRPLLFGFVLVPVVAVGRLRRRTSCSEARLAEERVQLERRAEEVLDPGGAGAPALGRPPGARGRCPTSPGFEVGRGLPGRHRADGRRLLRRVPRRRRPASRRSSATSPATASSRRSPRSRPSTCCGCSSASTATRRRRSRSSTGQMSALERARGVHLALRRRVRHRGRHAARTRRPATRPPGCGTTARCGRCGPPARC